jgi:hypothetical protein
MESRCVGWLVVATRIWCVTLATIAVILRSSCWPGHIDVARVSRNGAHTENPQPALVARQKDITRFSAEGTTLIIVSSDT